MTKEEELVAARLKLAALIAPTVSQAVVNSWNSAIDACVELAKGAGHYMVVAEMLLLKISDVERVNRGALETFRERELRDADAG